MKIIVTVLILTIITPMPISVVRATTISALPWDMDTEPDLRYDCESTPGLCGASADYYATGGWDDGPRVVVTPPTSCRNQNGQYAGLSSLDFPDGTDIYIRFLLKWNVDMVAYANDCGLNTQIKMIISEPDTRGMVIAQPWCGSNADYHWAPCENNSCDWATNICGQHSGGQFDSGDYIGEYVYFEAHFDGDGSQVRLWTATQDGEFSYATEGNPMATKSANIGSPIQYLDGLGLYFNGSFNSGLYLTFSSVRIDDEFIGLPSGFGTPTVSSAVINGTSASIIFSEDLDDAAFANLINGDLVMTGTTTGAADLESCSENSGTVTCTVASSFVTNEAVSLSSSGLTGDELCDASSNCISSLSNESVTNNTPAPDDSSTSNGSSGSGCLIETLF